MTIPEFVEELKKLNLRWFKHGYSRYIRCDRGDCPITALARSKGFVGGNGDYVRLGRELGLEYSDTLKIIDTADRINDSYVPEILELAKADAGVVGDGD